MDSPRTVFKEKMPLIYLIKKTGASVCLTAICIVKMIKIIVLLQDVFGRADYQAAQKVPGDVANLQRFG